MTFEAIDLVVAAQHDSTFHLESIPPRTWIPITSSSCSFPGAVFEQVMLNLVGNPNLNTSWVFRADILFDSSESAGNTEESSDENELDHDLNVPANGAISGTTRSQGQESHDPRDMDILGFDKTRTMVRKMISRNPQRDQALIQTCHFYSSNVSAASNGMNEPGPGTSQLVVYIPHVTTAEEIPYYHPKVHAIAFLWTSSYISIHYSPFHSTDEISTRLRRTATQLLQTLHKHGHGTAAGYVKRVHHDTILPQARVQDTYTRLKTVHAKRLLDNWVEVTDPSKHVFEDLGIAAFLIELCRETVTEPVTEPVPSA